MNEANSTGSDRDQNAQALADAGMDLVVGVGFAFSPGLGLIAPDYPDTNFMIVDGYATCGTACGLTNDADVIPNVADYTFKEQEGSFLVGAAAALVRVRHARSSWADRTADREIPGRLRGRAAQDQPRHPRCSSSTSATTPLRSTTRSGARSSRP